MSCSIRPRTPRILPVAVDRDRDLPVLVALLGRGEEMLAPVLDPLYRPAELQRGRRYHRLLRIEDRLGPEAAADIGRDHADRFQIAAEQIGERAAAEMRRLRRRPHGEQVGRRLVRGEHRARLHRHAAAAMLPELLAGRRGAALAKARRHRRRRAGTSRRYWRRDRCGRAARPSLGAARQSTAAGRTS